MPLFDLPLHPESEDPTPQTKTRAELDGAAGEATADEAAPGDKPAPQTRLFATAEDDGGAVASVVEAPSARFLERLQAGLADLAVHVLMLAVAVTAAYRLGVRVTWEHWPPFTVLTLVFSFLYWMIPLAFWGQTPGMAWVGHLARSLDDEPLSFHQTFLRWIGALFTFAFAGLPLLLALGGSSLSDRLSQSKTSSVEV